MDAVTLAVGGLAVWRLSRAFVKEDGPLMMFARLRGFLAQKQSRRGGMFDMISCIACTSFWIGLLAALWPAETLLQVFWYGLSFSAIAVLLEALTISQTYKSTQITKDITI